jgi:hypothetical protein
MNIEKDITYYHFDWVHNDNNIKKEPYIHIDNVYSTAQLYGWSVKKYNRPITSSYNKLVDCYNWFILTKL